MVEVGRGDEEATCIIGGERVMEKTYLVIFKYSADDKETGISLCGGVLTSISMLLVILTLPFSLCVCFKVRAVLVQG